MAMNGYFLSVRKLSVEAGTKKLVTEVSFEQPLQTVLGIYGPNGSGKTSLLKAICGLRSENPVSGEVYIESVGDLENLSPVKRAQQILYLASEFQSPFHLTVRDLIEMGAKTASTDLWPELQSGDRSRIAEIVESMSLTDLLPRDLDTLSDGEKQLVMFARCLVQKPKVLALDESLSKLDLDHLMLVAKMIRKYSEKGMTFVVISHDLNFLSEIADEILFMKKSKLLAKGPTNEVLTTTILADLYPGLSLQVVKSPDTGSHKVLY